jgi:hypothetical protein
LLALCHHVIINNLTGRLKTAVSSVSALIIGAARVKPKSSISKKKMGCISVASRIPIGYLKLLEGKKSDALESISREKNYRLMTTRQAGKGSVLP